jgi:F-type H+-transporting ATPase subunit epsilon
MAKAFQLEVVTPEGTALSTRAVSLQAPAWEGYLGVLAGHAPLLCVLRPGVLTVREDEKSSYFAVKGGFMEVQPDRVIVLADAIERADEVDPAEAEKALAAAQEPPPPPQGATAEARGRAREEAARAREEAARWAEARLAAVERSRGGATAA